MVASMVNSAVNYSDYSEAQLFAVLNEIQAQKASLDSREKQIREILRYVPNEETRKALDDDFVVAQGISHKEFMESLDNEAY